MPNKSSLIRLLCLFLATLTSCGSAPDATVITVTPGRDTVVDTPEGTETVDLRPDNVREWTHGVLCDMDGPGACTDHYISSEPNITDLPGWTAMAGTEKAICNGNDGQCFPCADYAGCKATADNSVQTYCNFEDASNSDMEAFHFGTSWGLQWLSSHPLPHPTKHTVGLPSGYGLQWRAPWSGQPNECAGQAPCQPGSSFSCWLTQHVSNPTKTDMIFQHGTLANTPNGACNLPACPGAGCPNVGNQRWLACTSGIGTQSSWNNGFGTHSFTRAHGSLITIDPSAVQIKANTAGDGISLEDSMRTLYVHLTCHEVGHTFGLEHAAPGGADPPNELQSSCMSAVQPNPIGTVPWYHRFEWEDLRNSYESVNGVPKWTYAPPRGAVEF